jgi:hypothetical protein
MITETKRNKFMTTNEIKKEQSGLTYSQLKKALAQHNFVVPVEHQADLLN